MKNLFFWAQSLDNEAPDLIIRDDVAISDEKSREELVSKIYKFSRKKIKIILSEAGVTIRYSPRSFKFVVEVIPDEKDQINRLSPIIIYGDLLEEAPETIKNICNQIHKVVTETIKRTLSQDAEEAIAKGLELIAKKKEAEQISRNSTISWFPRLIVNLVRYLVNKVQNFLHKI